METMGEMSFRYQQQPGRDVFILGAGFSKAISESMPLLNELSAVALDRLHYRKDAEPIPFLGSSEKANVELAMTYLSQRHPWLSEADFLYNKARVADIIDAITVEIERRTLEVVQSPCPSWLQRFVSWLHYRRATVITLNYDTLLERAYSLIEMGQANVVSEPLRYNVEVDVLYPISFRAQRGQVGVGIIPTSEILKLHGSTNWYYSGRASYFGEAITLNRIEGWQHDRNAPLPKPNGRVPLLVPPVSDKVGYFENEEMHHLWMRAADAIRKADRIFCIGYSLPETDLTMRFLLQSNVPSEQIDFYVVNPSTSLPNHFRDLIPQKMSVRDDYALPDAVEIFVNDLFTDQLYFCNDAVRGEASDIQRRITQKLKAGDALQLPNHGARFTVGSMDDYCVMLLVGDAQVPLPLPWKGLEEVFSELTRPSESVLEGPKGIEIGGVGYEEDNREISVHTIMSRRINRSSAFYVAAVLQQAELATIDQRYGSYRLYQHRPI